MGRFQDLRLYIQKSIAFLCASNDEVKFEIKHDTLALPKTKYIKQNNTHLTKYV